MKADFQRWSSTVRVGIKVGPELRTYITLPPTGLSLILPLTFKHWTIVERLNVGRDL